MLCKVLKVSRQGYYKWLNNIDKPEQFGIKPFLKIFPGQSKIQYNFLKNYSVGISTQNLWWGPGIKNSLLMTNNAAGFLHQGFGGGDGRVQFIQRGLD